MKKHNILKVILCVVLLVTLCTWIFPTISFSSSLVEDGTRTQLGIFDFFSYIVEIFRYFPYIILMTLATGIFYGVAHKIPAYRALLDKIVSGFKGKENIFLAVVMALIAIFVSVSGLSFGMIFVFPLIISIVLLMGYNKLVAASVTVGSTAVGLLGITLGSNATYYINAILSTEVFNEIISKIVLLVISIILLIFNVLRYANKTKNNTDKVVELVPSDSTEEEKTVEVEENKEKVTSKIKSLFKKKESTKTTNAKKEAKGAKETKTKKSSKDSKSTKAKKQTKKSTKTRAYDLKAKDDIKVVKPKKNKVHVWPFVLIFDLVFIILMVSTFDWIGVFKVDWFEQALAAVQKFEVAGFPIFAKVLGNVSDFGTWSLNYEIPCLIFLATSFLAFIYGLKFDEFLDGAIEGIKKALKPAIYMFIVYLVLIIVTYNPFQLHFTKFLVNLTDGLNVITMTVVAMLASVLNIESVYVAQSTLPYVTSVITDSSLYPLLAVIFQSVYGLMMLIAPTSVILLGTLTYLDISYTQWIKHIWKLFLELLLVLVIVFLILFLI